MDYEYLSLAIGEAGAGGPRQADDAARASVYRWAIDALHAVAGGGSPLRAVTHPLGFTCLPIERAGPDGVCVHLWSPRLTRAAPTTSVIHSHCWHLTSYMLFGRLENRLIDVADAGVADAGVAQAGGGDAGGHGDRSWDGDGTGAGEQLYRMLEVRSSGDIDELVPTSRLVRCQAGARQVAGAGDVYAVAAGEFHTSYVDPGAEAATVALGRVAPGAADRSLGPVGAAGHQVRRQRCDEAQTAAAARIVLNQLIAFGRMNGPWIRL
jgi:hypothetical protein